MSGSSLERPDRRVAIDALRHYRDRVDVRSPSEFAIDHLPGATNHPVLDDAERVRIGTMHAQDSAFAARHAGAAIVVAAIERQRPEMRRRPQEDQQEERNADR